MPTLADILYWEYVITWIASAIFGVIAIGVSVCAVGCVVCCACGKPIFEMIWLWIEDPVEKFFRKKIPKEFEKRLEELEINSNIKSRKSFKRNVY